MLMSGLRLKSGLVEAELMAVLRDKHGLMGFNYPIMLGLLDAAMTRSPAGLRGSGLHEVAEALCDEASIKRYDLQVPHLTSMRSDGLIDDDDRLTDKGRNVLREMAGSMEPVRATP